MGMLANKNAGKDYVMRKIKKSELDYCSRCGYVYHSKSFFQQHNAKVESSEGFAYYCPICGVCFGLATMTWEIINKDKINVSCSGGGGSSSSKELKKVFLECKDCTKERNQKCMNEMNQKIIELGGGCGGKWGDGGCLIYDTENKYYEIMKERELLKDGGGNGCEHSWGNIGVINGKARVKCFNCGAEKDMGAMGGPIPDYYKGEK
jgi:hypothetical protein